MSISLLAESVAYKVLAGERITRDDALELYRLPLSELGELAHLRRTMAAQKAKNGRERIVPYIVDRSINNTNVCNVYCKFCHSCRTETAADHSVLTPAQ